MTERTFNIEFKPSRRLGGLVLLMHVLAIVAVWATAVNWAVQGLLIVLLLLSAGYYWQTLLRQATNNRQLQYLPDNGWRLSDNNQQMQPVTLQQCFVSQPLLIINYRQARGRRALLLLSDSADPQAMRKLRVYLRQA